MGKYVACPYYRYDRDCRIFCEGGVRRFRDRERLRRHRARYCGRIGHYRECAVARKIDRRYEEADYERERDE